MKAPFVCSSLVIVFWIVSVGFATAETDGLTEVGGDILTGYEDRPVGTTGSWYSEAGGFFRWGNRDAVLDLDISGEWYQRYSRFFKSAADHRYSFQAGIGASENRLQWGVSSLIRRSLSSQTDYNPDTGQQPSAYLRNEASTIRRLSGDIQYRIPFSEKTELIPRYSAFYEEEVLNSGSEQRMQHEAGTGIQYYYSRRTAITAETAVQRQTGSEENGETVRIGLGAAWRYSEKTFFSGLFGWMAARYDQSGAAQSPYLDLKSLWQATDKTSFYCFGGSLFRPGTEGGAAEQVWRLGYGGDWTPRESWRISLQMLHQIEKPIDDTAGQETDRSGYLTVRIEKKINKVLAAHGSVRYLITSRDNNDSEVVSELGVKAVF